VENYRGAFLTPYGYIWGCLWVYYTLTGVCGKVFFGWYIVSPLPLGWWVGKDVSGKENKM